MTTPNARRGTFITLEGGEGTGKTTQAERLTKRLNQSGIPTIMVREPGATPLGNHLRNYLKGRGPICLKAETLLFAAARAQSVSETVQPALNSGVTVVSDRYAASTHAYQGHGRRGDMAMISTLNEYVTEGIRPDIYILLDIDPAEGLGRAGKPQMEMALGENDRTATSRTDEHNERRFEDQPLAFHNRVRRGYLQLAKDDPTWKTINADQSPDDVEQQIWEAVLTVLPANP